MWYYGINLKKQMKRISAYISLSLIMLMMGTFSVFAAEDAPPSITFDFEDSEDDAPPSLSTPPSNNNTVTTTPTPPPIPSPGSGSNDTPPKITFTFDPNQAAATTTTNNNSTNISETGPETGYLIFASLILGHFANSYYKKVAAQKSLSDK